MEWVSPIPFAQNYGSFVDTLADDGDALDVIIACSHPLPPGTLVEVRPVDILYMEDRGCRDEKIVAVAVADPLLSNVVTTNDIPGLSRQYVEDFLEKMKAKAREAISFSGWGDNASAEQYIERAKKVYDESR